VNDDLYSPAGRAAMVVWANRLPIRTVAPGRADDVEELAGLLGSHRLVTLVGPGGVGKSRLAVQVGADLVDHFANGVWMCELAAVAAGDGLVPAVLEALGAPGSAGVDPRAHLLDVLGRWQALLILDNCEHLLDEVGRLVRGIGSGASQVTVLVTSREALHLPGEQLLSVRPLAVPRDAVELFVDRARQLEPSFTLSDVQRPVVVEICQALDGLPLAIELAAARTVSMTPSEIVGMLDQRFRLLSGRASDTHGHHGSLGQLVDWSYDLLTPALRSFFAELSVFSGAFQASAAKAVGALDDDLLVVDRLSELADKSMVTAVPAGPLMTYRLLETMRQYAAAQVPELKREALQARYRRYYAELAEQSWEGIRNESNQKWFDLIDAEFSNIRAAIDQALSIGDVDAAVRISGGLHMYNHTRRLPEIYR
jgi:predicted ATPase